jgi:phosphoglycerol transferase MdoB-like AlkP superfamily enzyme
MLLRHAVTYVKRRACYLLWPAWIVLFVEFLSRGAITETALWGLRRFPLFLANAVLVACLLLLIAAAVGRARIALGVVALLLAVPAALSGIKLRMLGLPALPGDISLLSEADSVVHLRDLLSAAQVAGILLFGAVGVWLAVRLGRERAPARERVISAAVAAALLGTAWLAPPSLYGARALDSDQAQNVRTNGFLLSGVYNLKALSGNRRRPANPEAVAALAAALPQPVPPPAAESEGVKPNIIVVLSESLFDLTQLPGVTYSRDPLPFFHELQAQYTHGTMLSPMFGGGTANVELEVLTGLSMRFLPEGAIPYDQYITHGVDSLAAILSRQGYTATAITPWSNWFFHNNIVYRNLGFHRLITNEFMRMVFSGPNIPDSEVASLIMAETAKTEGPDFIFANTGENHYPYNPGKFAANTIAVQGLTEPAKGLLETYAQGCSAADQMLRTLVEHYQQPGEPTMIVWFGDHKPVLGPDYLVYRESGYISGTGDPDFVNKMYEVPVLVWNNYLPSAPVDTLHISPSFLSPYVLDLAGRPGTAFTAYLKELSRRLPVIPPERFWAAQQIPKADLDRYSALEQDILFGDQKTYGDLKDRIVDPTYELGYGPLVIDRVEAREAMGSGDLPVTLHGRHFPPRAGVYADGTKVDATWVDAETVTAIIPAGLARKNPLAIELRLIDAQKSVIARSDPFRFLR